MDLPRAYSCSDCCSHLSCPLRSYVAAADSHLLCSLQPTQTPGTGLYDNLEAYGKLPYAEAIFDLRYFAENPAPFYRLCKELWPGQYSPTPTHTFIRLLHDKGVLRRCYTQNIDSLESAAGLPSESLVAAHGNFDTATVHRADGTSVPVPIEQCREATAAEGMDGWEQLNAEYRVCTPGLQPWTSGRPF